MFLKKLHREKRNNAFQLVNYYFLKLRKRVI